MAKKLNDDVERMTMNELKREVRRLRKELPTGNADSRGDSKAAFALWLREVYHNRGFPGVIEEAYTAQQRLVARIAELQTMIPFEVLDPDTLPSDAPIRKLRDSGRWQYSLVGVNSVARDSDGSEYDFFKGTGVYFGEREVAAADLGTRILLNLYPTPMPDDLPKSPRGLETVEDEMFDALVELALIEDGDEWKAARLKQFDMLWAKLDTPEYEMTRPEAMDRFYKYIDAAFKNFEERRRRYQIAGVKRFHKELEEGDV